MLKRNTLSSSLFREKFSKTLFIFFEKTSELDRIPECIKLFSTLNPEAPVYWNFTC